MKKISTIILAAGKSTRFNSKISKVFHKIADLSLIDYVISAVEKIPNNNIVIVCNNKNIKYFKEKYSQYKLVLQKKSIGSADAVFSAKKEVSKSNHILVLFGDVPLVESNTIKRLIKNYISTKKIGSMLVFNAEKPYGYGRVETINKEVIKVTEEFQANYQIKKIKICNSGIMICNQKFLFDNIKKIKKNNIKKEKLITDLFNISFNLNKSFSYSFCSEKELQGINTREDLIKADQFLQKKLKNKLIKNGITILQPETVRVSYDTKIGKDSIIEPFVTIKRGVTIGNEVNIKSHSTIENCKIGEQSNIGPFARIRPLTSIGKKVKIGNYVEIKNSVIGDSTSISHLSYIGDSFIGKNVNIGAGTITCNYDGKKKYKTIIKNNVFIGSNTSLIAPLIIGQNSHVGAGSVITQDVPSFSLALERNKQKNILKKTRKNTKI